MYCVATATPIYNSKKQYRMCMDYFILGNTRAVSASCANRSFGHAVEPHSSPRWESPRLTRTRLTRTRNRTRLTRSRTILAICAWLGDSHYINIAVLCYILPAIIAAVYHALSPWHSLSRAIRIQYHKISRAIARNHPNSKPNLYDSITGVD